MAIITTDNQHYTDIANAIRSAAGSSDQYKPEEMATAISEIVDMFLTTSILSVTAPAGSTVTCAKGEVIKNATEKNGKWWFWGLENGEWTLKATLGGQTATRTVNITQFDVYRIAMSYFAATIAVTYPAGSTCTCSKDGEVLTAPDTSGSHTFTVTSAGVWTVTVTDGIKTEWSSVNITRTNQNETIVIEYYFWIFRSGQGAVIPLEYGNQSNAAYEVSKDSFIHIMYEYPNTSSMMRTEQRIDLSNYSEIIVDAQCTRQPSDSYYGSIVVAKNIFYAGSHPDSFAGRTKYAEDGVRKLYVLDVSSFSGEYYIGSWGSTSATIYNMYLR